MYTYRPDMTFRAGHILSAEEAEALTALANEQERLRVREQERIVTQAGVDVAKAAILTVIGTMAAVAIIKALAPKGVLPAVSIIRQDTTPNIFVTEQVLTGDEKPVGT